MSVIRKHLVRARHEPLYQRTGVISPRRAHLKLAAVLIEATEEKMVLRRATANFSKAYRLAKQTGLLEAYKQVALEKALEQFRSMKGVKASKYREIVEKAIDKAFETGKLKDGLKLIDSIGKEKRLGIHEIETIKHAVTLVLGSTIAFDENDLYSKGIRDKVKAVKKLPDIVSEQLRRQLGIVDTGGSMQDAVKGLLEGTVAPGKAVIILDDKVITDSRNVAEVRDGEPHPLYQLRRLQAVPGNKSGQGDEVLQDDGVPDPVTISIYDVIKGKYRIDLLEALLGDDWYEHYAGIEGEEGLNKARNEVIENILRGLTHSDRKTLSQYYLYKVAQIALDTVSKARNVYEAEALFEKAFNSEVERDPLFRRAVFAKAEELDEKEFAIAHLLHLSSKTPLSFTESFTESIYAMASTVMGSLPFGRVAAVAAAGARGAGGAVVRTVALADEFSFWTTTGVDAGYVPLGYIHEQNIARSDLRKLVVSSNV